MPAEALLGGEGQAFAIAQTRLGGGRIHHAMRTIGHGPEGARHDVRAGAEPRDRGQPAGRQAVRAGLHRRLLRPAHAVPAASCCTPRGRSTSTTTTSKVRKDIAAVKVVMPTVLHDIARRAMQVHGALGASNEMPFVGMIHGAGVMGLADGPDRGAQGHRGQPGAARLQAGRRPVADRAPAQAAGGARGRSTPTILETRWATCEHDRRGGERRVARRRHADDRRRGEAGAWLDTQGLGVGRRSSTTTSPAGSQNEIYEIRRGDLHCALRIPPPERTGLGDEGILREWRIIEALDGTDVPHTEAIAVCTDASVLGRTFYLMGFVDGWSPMSTRRRGRPRSTPTSASAADCAFQLVEGIALLSKVDWQAKGLPTWAGRTASTSARSTGGPPSWSGSRDASCPASTRRPAWLRAHRPLDFIPGLMHGDYQFANVMFKHGAPARLAAHRRLGDGHRRRPQARPGLGGAVAGRTTPASGRGPRRRLRRHDRHAVARRVCWRTTPRSPAARSTTSTTTASWPSGSSRSCSSRASSAPATTRSCRRSARSCWTSCSRRPTWPSRRRLRCARPDVRAAVCRAYGARRVEIADRGGCPSSAAGRRRRSGCRSGPAVTSPTCC